MRNRTIIPLIIAAIFISLTSTGFLNNKFAVGHSFSDSEKWDDESDKNIQVVCFDKTEDMQSHFTNELRLCYVRCDDSKYSDGYQGNFYEYIDHPEFGEIELENGGFAKLLIPAFLPLKDNNDECIQTILKIASSYMNVGIKYKAINGPFKVDPDSWNGIQCSQFVTCLLYGLPFNNSKLHDPDNTNSLISGGLSYGLERLSEGGYSAWQLARFAAGHGWLCKTSSFESVKLGDVVFFYDNNAKSNNWNSIVHTAMVVGKNNGKVALIEAGRLKDSVGQMFEYYKPNNTEDAVNIVVILNESTLFINDGFGLFGFARFPLHYDTLSY